MMLVLKYTLNPTLIPIDEHVKLSTTKNRQLNSWFTNGKNIVIKS
jgi:hypothetical protein